jgi:DNA-directed RNA polymerase specialized sigma subunit
MMRDYKIDVTREGRWWAVHIPEIDGQTQARRLAEATTMAREYIALDRGIALREVNVEVASVRIGKPASRELLESARQIRDLRAKAAELERESGERAREFAHLLVTHGVPVRDIAALLEISPQRVSQLANS